MPNQVSSNQISLYNKQFVLFINCLHRYNDEVMNLIHLSHGNFLLLNSYFEFLIFLCIRSLSICKCLSLILGISLDFIILAVFTWKDCSLFMIKLFSIFFILPSILIREQGLVFINFIFLQLGQFFYVLILWDDDGFLGMKVRFLEAPHF